MTPIRVLIVDDQDIVRRGLGVILQHQPDLEVTGFAADGLEAVEQVAVHRPDVVLLDLKMPKLKGIQATRQIARAFPAVKVVVLTTYDGDEWVFDAIRAGASGYLLKDSASEEIVGAVRGAAAGEVHIDPAVAGRVLLEFKRLAGQKSHSTPEAATPSSGLPLIETLTERERLVLQELVQGKTNREIADSLHLAEGTIKNYVSIIIAKLQANDRTQAAILALKRGLATLD